MVLYPKIIFQKTFNATSYRTVIHWLYALRINKHLNCLEKGREIKIKNSFFLSISTVKFAKVNVAKIFI